MMKDEGGENRLFGGLKRVQMGAWPMACASGQLSIYNSRILALPLPHLKALSLASSDPRCNGVATFPAAFRLGPVRVQRHRKSETRKWDRLLVCLSEELQLYLGTFATSLAVADTGLTGIGATAQVLS